MGGAEEAKYSDIGNTNLIINKRKGFFELALENNLTLVPIYTFGNNNIYKYVSIACILILFWPIMSTGSLIKNWNGVLTFYIIAICISLNRVKINK